MKLHSPFAGMIATPTGPTFVRVVGEGPPTLVVHGGPGFDQRYLAAGGLEGLARRRTLVFYDQPGCGATPDPPAPPTAEGTFRHFAEVVAAVWTDEPVSVVAH